MYLSHLRIEEFRSIRSLDIELPSAGFGLYGHNAAGKSSLLEAIAMLATTRSSRATNDREVINWESGADLALAPYSRIDGTVRTTDSEHLIQIGMDRDQGGSGRFRKVISVDNRPRRAATAIGTLKCVLFEPADIDLVSGSPSNRRRFLDIHLSQVDRVYLTALSRYQRIVDQRNSLLKSMQRDGVHSNDPTVRSQLEFWDTELVAHGSQVVARRMTTVRALGELGTGLLDRFTGGRVLSTTYATTTGAQPIFDRLDVGDTADPAQVGFAMQQELDRLRANEFRRGVTLLGPHRDDVIVTLDGMDVGTYGSRGQQRLSAVALKLAEAELMLAESGERPVVLLDDVLSELDPNHRGLLTGELATLGAQVIVTTTDRSLLKEAGLNVSAVARIDHGRFEWE